MKPTLDTSISPEPSPATRILGALLGGAVGDALGAPVEFFSLDEIRRRHGPSGVTGFEKAFGRKGAITDDTQMSLFTAEGLILSRVRQDDADAGLAATAIYHAYLRWLYTQDTARQAQLIRQHGTCAVIDGMLTTHAGLFAWRAPGQTCLSALRSGRMGTIAQPINASKGCGGVMRVAPVGFACADVSAAFQLGCASAAITHGHPTGYLSAGFMAVLIASIAGGARLPEAVDAARRILATHAGHEESSHAVAAAVALSRRGDPTPATMETLGAGWVADEALAMGLYAALVAGRDFRRGVLLAVNHSGDSDSTGAIAGSIIGACYGADVIPSDWLAELELRAVITEVAADLADTFHPIVKKGD
ncbi:Predicted ADP-ribosylglycohydrolase [Desulfosarcina cetonica]|nr:Predicted ADP-ribosylglycohydrolase [Desulfosarcina cetonica]